MTSTGGISVGWGSVRYPEIGRSVFLHEIAHVVSRRIQSNQASRHSQQKFQTILDCLAKNHADNPSSDRHVEEDWSDLLSGKGSVDPKNVACHFVNQENNRYSGLSLDAGDGQKHSSDFFRVLHTHKIKQGQLPSSCQQYAESQGPGWKFDVCL